MIKEHFNAYDDTTDTVSEDYKQLQLNLAESLTTLFKEPDIISTDGSVTNFKLRNNGKLTRNNSYTDEDEEYHKEIQR